MNGEIISSRRKQNSRPLVSARPGLLILLFAASSNQRNRGLRRMSALSHFSAPVSLDNGTLSKCFVSSTKQKKVVHATRQWNRHPRIIPKRIHSETRKR